MAQEHPPIKRRNHVRVLTGQGVTHTKTDRIGTIQIPRLQTGFVYGIGFDVPVGKSLTLGAELLSNDTQLISVGIQL